MADTPNLGLPYIMAAQAQKHVTHNEAIRALDALVHLAVITRDTTAPPGTPAHGDRYIVAAGGSGAWSGHDLEIAAFQDGAWAFFTPRPGWRAWIIGESALRGWNGSDWIAVGNGGGDGGDATFDTLSINASADETNRLALSSPASLFNHAGAGHQVKVNKAEASDTASFLFQTAFSGRAEMGTAGDDDFHFKVSPDGSAWHEAIAIDKDTGEVSFPSGVDIENPGLPSGGATGQVLSKASSANGDVEWITPAGGGDMLASMYDPQEIEADAFARANHTGSQPISTITDLQSALDGKASSAHDHDDIYAPASHAHDDRYYTESEVDAALAGKSNTGHGHVISDVATLQSALDGKAASSHGHAFADLTSKPTTLAGYGITDAATSAQGALADTAIQPDDLGTFVPGGGGTGQVLTKASGDDGDVEWVDPPGGGGESLPLGGSTGQVLAKASNDDGDVAWTTPAGGGDMLASVYDPGNVAGDAFDMDNMVEGTDTKIMTGSERSKLSAIEAAADVTDAGNVGAAIHGADAKTTPVDADTVALIDSAASNVLKKLSWENIKATLKTYFDTLYAAVAHGHAISDVTGLQTALDGKSGTSHNHDGIYQMLASALTSWAGVTRASGFDTFAATPSSANLRALLTDESGTGVAYFQGGALGTPSGGTLTNCGGLPVAGLVGSTSQAVGVGSVELGHATDTTLSRAAAGVLAVEGAPVAFRRPGRNAQTGTSYTLVAADEGRHVTMSNSSANTLTIPANASVAFPVDTIINVSRYGSGATTIQAASGVTINGVSAGAGAIGNRYQGVSLVKIATNEWLVQGDIGAIA